jgi:pSer/pThr/pTyr-binding forkhead associated (FHA) protein
MNSKNGTYVNSQRITDQVVVHNDIITIGNHQIKFVAPSAMHSSAQD